MTKLKTLKDLKPASKFHRNKFSVREGHTELISKEELKDLAIKRCKFIKETFLDNFDKIQAKTPREAYLHQLGKFEELKRFCSVTEEDLK